MALRSCFVSLIIGIFLFSYQANCTSVDSLRAVLPDVSGEDRTAVLHDLAYALLFSDTDEAEKFVKQLITYSQENELYNGEARGYYLWGVCGDLRGQYGLAIDRYQKALKILLTKVPENEWTIWAVHNGMGMAYSRKGDYVLALEHLFQCVQTSDQDESLPNASHALLNIASVYQDMQDYPKALQYYERSKEESEAINNSDGIAKAIHNKGLVYKEMGAYNEALAAYREALVIKEIIGNKLSLSTSYSSIGDVMMELEQYDSALYYLDMAEKLKTKIDDQWGLTFINLVRAKIYLKRSDFDKAEAILKETLENTTESANKGEVYDGLYELYREKQDYATALKWYIQKEDYEDSLINARKHEQLAEMQTLYELSQKENEIIVLENEREAEKLTKNIYMILGLTLLILGAFVFYVFYSRSKKRQDLARVREEELQKEIDFKKKELASYTLNFVQKNSLLSEIKEEVEKLKNITGNAREIRAIKRIVDDGVRLDKDWEIFKVRFEEVHEDFFRKLTSKYPNLGANDLKISALIRLNMNVKEASQIMGISPDSVKTARYRLRKKMDLAKEANLTTHLASIEQTA